jgi:hypothetical protein
MKYLIIAAGLTAFASAVYVNRERAAPPDDDLQIACPDTHRDFHILGYECR